MQGNAEITNGQENLSPTPQSRWVFFRKKSSAEAIPPEQGLLKLIGTTQFQVWNSSFYGMLSDGASTKPVYPSTYAIEQELLNYEKADPRGPWYLPVFITETPFAFRAYAIDDSQLNLLRGKWVPESDYLALKREVSDIRSIVMRLHEECHEPVAQKVLIFIDYQNLYRSLKEHAIDWMIEDVIEILCRWGAPVRRKETLDDGESLVYIFDFFHSGFVDLYTAWKMKKYNFIEVTPGPSGTNPTDRVIIETAKTELQRLKDKIDAFCIVSGDKIFHEILTEARLMGKKTIVAAFPDSTARELYIVSDLYCNLSFFADRVEESSALACLGQTA